MTTTSGKDEPFYLSDDSDELDLQTVSRKLLDEKTVSTTSGTTGETGQRTDTTASTATGITSAITSAVDSKDDNGNNGSDEDPDWVREFAVKQDEDEDRKRALSSLYEANDDIDDDDDRDSIIDLISERDEDSRLGQSAPDGASAGKTGEKGDEIEIVSSGKVRIKAEDKKGETSKKRTKPGNIGTGAGTGTAGSGASLKGVMPLVVAPKLDDSLVLLQGSGEELDLSGDVGTVGRVKMTDGQLYIDLKGGVFKASTYATNCMAVMGIHDDEARITSVLDEAVLLTCERNLFASDQVLKGDINCGDDDEYGDDDIVHNDNVSHPSAKVNGTGHTTGSGSGDASVGSGRGRGRGRGRGQGRGRGSGGRSGSVARASTGGIRKGNAKTQRKV